MRYPLQILESSSSGVPYTNVPLDAMWDLVEYLSWQRVAATYNFATTHFTVTFTHLDMAGAKRLVADWEATHERADQVAELDAASRADRIRAFATSH